MPTILLAVMVDKSFQPFDLSNHMQQQLKAVLFSLAAGCIIRETLQVGETRHPQENLSITEGYSLQAATKEGETRRIMDYAVIYICVQMKATFTFGEEPEPGGVG